MYIHRVYLYLYLYICLYICLLIIYYVYVPITLSLSLSLSLSIYIYICSIGANRLILLDCDWNPAIDRQTMARIWREGQTRPVHITRFICCGTIEQSIVQVSCGYGLLCIVYCVLCIVYCSLCIVQCSLCIVLSISIVSMYMYVYEYLHLCTPVHVETNVKTRLVIHVPH